MPDPDATPPTEADGGRPSEGAEPGEPPDRPDDGPFWARHVVVGMVVGVVLWIPVMFVTLTLTNPDLGDKAALGVAAWSGLWGGVFLGGVAGSLVASARSGHDDEESEPAPPARERAPEQPARSAS